MKKNDTIKLHPDAGLTVEFVQEMQQALLDEKNKLEGELSAFTVKNPRVAGDTNTIFPKYGTEPEDNAHEVEDFITNKSLEEVLEKQLRDVESALKRIADGTYGMCKFTHKPIGEKRLRARPTSNSTVEAKKFLTDEA
jgi:DnaK suppressor protein